MLRKSIICLAMLVLFMGGTALAKLTFYAPDIRWDDLVHGYLGLVNPEQVEIRLTLYGYDRDGTLLGSKEIVLPRFGRLEEAANEVLEGETPAWIKLESETPIAGYLRYEHSDGRRLSLLPLQHFPGDRINVAQLGRFELAGAPEIVMINTSEGEGSATLQPLVQGKHDKAPLKAEPVIVPGFGGPLQQTALSYESSFDKDDLTLFWDTIETEGNLSLLGVQHFGMGTAAGPAMSSIALPLSTYRYMASFPLIPDTSRYATHLVLINTYTTPLSVLLTVHFELIEAETLLLELEPLEKRVLEFDNPYDIPYAPHAMWYQIKPLEAGLIGFQLFKDKQTGALAAVEANQQPSSLVYLPFTPYDGRLTTTLTLINPTLKPTSLYAAGFNDRGRIVALKTNISLRPKQKKVMTTLELFGEKASAITWTRIASNDGDVSATALVCTSSGGDMAALQGIGGGANVGAFYFADFEQFTMPRLLDQGWTGYQFDEHLRPTRTQFYRDHYFDESNTPAPGQFFMETAFKGFGGNLPNAQDLYVGYEPVYTKLNQPFLEVENDTVAFLSPFFEVPHAGDYYISYHMRFFNPLHASKTSRYGLIMREEGSTQWTWFGLEGRVLHNPPATIFDCWEQVCYNGRWIVATAWLPFEMKLPEQFLGKRMQIGLFFDHVPDYRKIDGPTYFIDAVRITPQRLRRAHFFPTAGFGVLETENPPQ